MCKTQMKMYKAKNKGIVKTGMITRMVITTGNEKSTLEIYHAEQFVHDRDATNHFRVKINRSWYPDSESYFTHRELIDLLEEKAAINNSEEELESKGVSVQSVYDGLVQQSTMNIRPNLDEKYKDPIAALQQRVYTNKEVDDYFASKYKTDVARKQTERAFFDELPFKEQQAYMARVLGHISPKSTNTNELSGKEATEAERVNNMSPDEQRKWILQQQKSAKDRLGTDKDARKKEKKVKKENDNIDELPYDWN